MAYRNNPYNYIVDTEFTISELLRIASDAVGSRPRNTVDMSYFHKAKLKKGKLVCVACLGGAAVEDSVNQYTLDKIEKEMLTTIYFSCIPVRQIAADYLRISPDTLAIVECILDHLRTGNIEEAFDEANLIQPKYIPDLIDVPIQIQNYSRGWEAYSHDYWELLADMLEECGY